MLEIDKVGFRERQDSEGPSGSTEFIGALLIQAIQVVPEGEKRWLYSIGKNDSAVAKDRIRATIWDSVYGDLVQLVMDVRSEVLSDPSNAANFRKLAVAFDRILAALKRPLDEIGQSKPSEER